MPTEPRRTFHLSAADRGWLTEAVMAAIASREADAADDCDAEEAASAISAFHTLAELLDLDVGQ